METEIEKVYVSDLEIIKDNYHELFTKWYEAMKPYINPNLKLITTNSEILEYKYDNNNYLVTDNDIERTRIIESQPYKEYNF